MNGNGVQFHWLSGLLGILLASTIVMADGTRHHEYRWQRTLELPEHDQTSLFRLPLDVQFHDATRKDWPDVRVVNEQQQPVPFVIRATKDGKSHSIRHFWRGTISNARLDSAEGLKIEVQLGEKELVPNGLRILTPLKDFEHQVHVESSENGTMWRPLGAASLIFDYSRYVDARNVFVPFERTDHRHFRLIIKDVTAEQQQLLLELNRRLKGNEEVERVESTSIALRPFRVDGIEFYRDESKIQPGQPQTEQYSPASLSVMEDAKKQQTTLLVSVQQQPISELKLITSAENFSRVVTIESELENADGLKEWVHAGKGTASRFAIGAIQREQVTVSIPEVRTRQFRVKIENRDSPPLPITSVELTGPLYELIVAAPPHSKLMLEYGSPHAKAGHYDDAALLSALAQGESIVSVTASAPVENSSASTQRGGNSPIWNDTRVLFGMIAVLTVLLGWGLYRAGHRIASTDPE
ncbi:hypothetical protein [Schlesneria sp. DSM 10557]|uniref:hypothetical protein n=1 Tax=Schlesneria sp. DSM 10557 TaxID=3044399 RepID=UPI00359F22F1